MKAIAKRTFLLRQVNGLDVVAHRGEIVEVTDEEFKKLSKSLLPFTAPVKETPKTGWLKKPQLRKA